jgi:Domain of unknown function (DUF4234)
MAAQEMVMPTGARAKVRSEGLVALWGFLTLGIYTLVWYYKINREMRDFGRAHGDEELAETNPVLSILAVVPGFILLFIPPIVSFVRTTGRIRRVQRACNVPLTEGWIVGLLAFVGVIIGFANVIVPPYVQSGLNKVWRLYPPAEGDKVDLAGAPTPPQAEPAPAAPPAQADSPEGGEAPPEPDVPPQAQSPDPAERLD